MTSPQDEQVRVYEQLCNSYREIDDFRAKLLGLLPLITGAGISFLLRNLENAGNIPSETKILFAGVGVFGALITLGLFSYELFGIKKCAALIKAGQNLETLMDIENGQFRKRPQNIACVINEPFAAGVIYPTVLAAWMCFALAFSWPGADPWIPVIVFVLGFVGTIIFDFNLRRFYWQKAPLGTKDKGNTWDTESANSSMQVDQKL
jgi:hypothetical protein